MDEHRKDIIKLTGMYLLHGINVPILNHKNKSTDT